jgi:hypothetical protein
VFTNRPKKHLLIPAAGLGSRFTAAGYKKLKPFLRLGSGTLLSRVIEDCEEAFGGFDSICVGLPKEAPDLRYEGVSVVEFGAPTRGAAETVLLMLVDHMTRFPVAPDDVVVIANSDQTFELHEPVDPLPGMVLTFKNDFDPKWSYLVNSPFRHIVEKPNKNIIEAVWRPTCGIYISTAKDILIDLGIQIRDNNRHGPNQEFYLAPALDLSIPVEVKSFHGLGTPEDYETYARKEGIEIEKITK